MSGFVRSLRSALLNHFFGKVELTWNASRPLYIGLSSTPPTSSGGNFTEETIGNNNYARAATTPSDWDVAVDGDPCILDNANPVTFNVATGGPWLGGNDVTHVGIFESASGGTPIAWGVLPVAKPILENDIANYAAGDIDVTMNGS